MNPSVRAQELIGLSNSMTELMTSEIESLKAGNVSGIEPLQAQKETLSNLYAAHMQEIAADPGMFSSIEPALREELTAAATTFESVAEQNKRTVQAALELNARVVQVIADAVMKSAPSAAGYTKTGAAPGPTGNTGLTPQPATLNRSL